MTRSASWRPNAAVDQLAEDEGVDGADHRIEHDHGQEDGQDPLVGHGEGQHAPGGALLDPVLQHGAILAERAHAGEAATPSATHGVAPHPHQRDLSIGPREAR